MSTCSESSSVVTVIDNMQRLTEETQPWKRMMANRDQNRDSRREEEEHGLRTAEPCSINEGSS